MISIPLFQTDEHACSYLDDKSARTAFVHPSFPLTVTIYSQLIAQGFRRSGDDVYTPNCLTCRECVPVRIPVDQFTPNRRQKRCLKRNRHTETVIKPAAFDPQHYNLYLRYQHHRHAGGSMADSSPEDYIRFLGSNWCNTLFVELKIEQKLAGVAIVDLLDNALSAVYTFFDPDLSGYSLGTYSVLWQIEHARQLGLDYVYLGYWIKDCGKMNYKNQYQPLYGFIDQQWRPIVI